MLLRSVSLWSFSLVVAVGIAGGGLVFWGMPGEETGAETAAAAEGEREIRPSTAGVEEDWFSGVKEYIAEDERKIRRHSSGVLVANTQRGFRGFFSGRGVLVVPSGTEVGKEDQASWRWKFALEQVGRPDRLNVIEREEPAFEGHQVSYDLGTGVREVWENRKEGLKQSVWINQRPGGSGRVVLEGRWSGDVKMRGDRNGIVMSSGGTEVLRFAGLVVRDARGVTLASGMGHSGHRMVLWYRDRDAQYPVELDPLLTSPGWSSIGDDQGNCSYTWSAGTAGDVNGDGYSDIIVGAPNFNTTNPTAGKAYIYHGGASGPSLTPDWESSGEDQADAKFGQAVATAGDVDGDGFSDIIVGAHRYDSAGSDNGKAYLYLGGFSGVLNTPDWSSSGDDIQDSAYFGILLAPAGDVNGDGYSDIIVGAYGEHGVNIGAGKAYVYHGGSGGLSLTADWSSQGDDDQIGATFGLGVASAGDVNGDGFSDVIVGASTYDTATNADAGKVYVFHGGPGGLSLTADWTTSGDDDRPNVQMGMMVSTAGDVNGDGYSDVVIGSHAYDITGTNEGRAYVYRGSASGLLGTPLWTSSGDEVDGAEYGRYVSTAGDVNGDGYADIIVGARNQDTPTVNAGKAFVYEGGPSGPSTTPIWTSSGDDQADANFGQTVATAGDVNGDGFSDVLVGASRFTTANGNVGKAYVYYGSGSGLTTAHDWRRASSQSGAYYGYSVSNAGDVNGDGYGDVIVGAHMFSTANSDAGRAYVYHGGASGLSNIAAWESSGDDDQAEAYFGTSVSTAGDVNGDGYSDVIVGADAHDTLNQNVGKAYVYHGGAAGLSNSAAWESSGDDDQANAYYGTSVSTAGDVDGDGYSDIIVSAQSYDTANANAGKAYVYHGSSSGLSTTPDWTSSGDDQDGALFGCSVSSAGDVDGNGYSDVIVGADMFDTPTDAAGKVYVYHGSGSGLSLTADWTSSGDDQDGDYFGSSVSTAGDVDGDGYSDVIVGAKGHDTGSGGEGKAYVFLGSGSGLSGTADWSSTAEDKPSAAFGASVSTAGDVNGDGYSDVIVGAPSYDTTNMRVGKAYVFMGSSSGLSLTTDWSSVGDDVALTYFGNSVSTAGDVNGDGLSDVIVGQYGPMSGIGAAFAFHGGNDGTLSVRPRQARADGSALVQLLGLSGAIDEVRLRLLARTCAGRTRARLIWEVKPFGVPFDLMGFGVGAWVDTTVAGTEYDQLVGGLVDNTLYHWRVRLQYLPHMNYSMWYSIGPNAAEEADFRTGVISGCVLDTECPPCQECVTGTCQDQAAGSDLKGDCTPDACNTGDCDGMGGCGFVGAGAPCGDQGVVCHVDDACDGVGGCTDNGFVGDGSACGDQGDTECDNPNDCLGGACQDNFEASGFPCGDQGVACRIDDTCDGTGGCFDNGLATTGTACDDGLYCTETDTCNAGGSCTGTGNPCDTGPECNNVCNEVGDNCLVGDGTPCNDGDLCTQTDTCQVGICTGSNPVICTALDQCHDIGTCNSGTGICTDPPKSNGTPCNDSDQCTQTDTCQSGVCTGSNNVVCTALDQCHDAGVCNSGTGICTDPPKSNGTPCNDGNNCSTNDTCQGGTCTAGATNKDTDGDTFMDGLCPGGTDCDDNAPAVNPGVVEQSYGQPMCNDTVDNDCDGDTDIDDTGCMQCTSDPECDDSNICTNDACVVNACQNTPVVDGSLCDDNNMCTQVDGCQAGVCIGTDPVVCMPLDQCHNAGTCDPGTGICSDPPKTDGTTCNDGLYCNVNEACQAGVCQGGSARDCSAFDDQCNQAACDDVGDTCYGNPVPKNGLFCDDGLYCNENETCQGGSCQGGSPMDCSAFDDQCNQGACDDVGDICYADPTSKEGLACDDTLYCTNPDTCTSGTCTGPTRPCLAYEDDCNAGACDEPGDTCYADPAPKNGLSCDDTLYCTVGETCLGGNCQGGSQRDCSGEDDLCNTGACDDIGDTCFKDPVPKNGDPCDDGDGCTMNDVCSGGGCVGGPQLDGDGDTFVSNACGGQDCNDGDPNINPNIPETPVGSPICTDSIDNDCDTLTDINDPGCSTCEINADCDDGDQCNGIETCAAPNCVGGTPLDCDDTNPCTNDWCDSGLGCQHDFNTILCDDGEFCTANDRCDGAGNCTGATGLTCATQCQTVCNESLDQCDPDPPATTCNDGLYCTNPDTCNGAGGCSGPDRDCSALDSDCHLGACNESGDTCWANPGLMDDQPCDDSDLCTQTDTCQSGVCLGANPLVCTRLDQCHDVGTCDPGTGLCSNPAKPDGTSCNDGDFCTSGDTCQTGNCVGSGGLSCSDGNPCTEDFCDQVEGCSWNDLPDGTACGTSCDDNLDWMSFTCRAGACTDSVLLEHCVNDNECTTDDCVDALGCSHTFNTNDCEDGEYCTVGDKCNQGDCISGEEKTCKDEAGYCWEGRCREEFNWCELGDPVKDPNTWCDDEDLCTGDGLCNGKGACRIEGFCDQIVSTCPTQTPAIAYVPGDPDARDCRFGENKVGIAVEVEPTPGGVGTFVPVRLLLSNTTVGGWTKELSELRVLLTLNPVDDVGGKIAYVMGSALLQGGDLYLEDDATVGGNRAMFRLFRHDVVEDVQMMPAPGGGIWALDFVLMRGEDQQGVFKVDVWAPCECLDAEIGCHYGYSKDEQGKILDLTVDESVGRTYLQRISGSKYVSTSGKAIDPENVENIGELLRSPVIGCQCGTQDGSGSAWLVLLGLIWVVRRKVRV